MQPVFFPVRKEVTKMSPVRQFRILKPTVGVKSADGRRWLVTIPEGSIIACASGALDNDRMVEIWWQDATLLVFAEDLAERGELLEMPSTEAARSPN